MHESNRWVKPTRPPLGPTGPAPPGSPRAPRFPSSPEGPARPWGPTGPWDRKQQGLLLQWRFLWILGNHLCFRETYRFSLRTAVSFRTLVSWITLKINEHNISDLSPLCFILQSLMYLMQLRGIHSAKSEKPVII